MKRKTDWAARMAFEGAMYALAAMTPSERETTRVDLADDTDTLALAERVWRECDNGRSSRPVRTTARSSTCASERAVRDLVAGRTDR